MDSETFNQFGKEPLKILFDPDKLQRMMFSEARQP